MAAEFNPQPTLTGNLVTLRPLRADDFDALFAAASDPLIWEQHPENTRYQREVFTKYFASGIECGGALVALDTKTGEMLGSSRFYSLDTTAKTILIGYTFLIRKTWGHGHNTEMKKLMLDHAFQWVETVFFDVGEKNLRSRRALEKIGASFMGQSDPLHIRYCVRLA